MKNTEFSKPQYEPEGAARVLLSDNAEEIILSGPAGTGKSRACLEKLHTQLELWPGSRALLLRKTRASLTETALVTFEQSVLPDTHPAHNRILRRTRQSYAYPNGSSLVVAGLDNPQRIMSTEYDLIYVQEATELSESDWEYLLTRLRNGKMPFQQLIADCNPDTPNHWIRHRAEKGLLKMLESRHEDNPRLWNPETGAWTEFGLAYIQKLERLTGPRYHRLRHGRWVGAEGIVYEGWDRAIHLIDRNHPFLSITTPTCEPQNVPYPRDLSDYGVRPWAFSPPPSVPSPLSDVPSACGGQGGCGEGPGVGSPCLPASWPRYWVVDFGFTNPFVWQAWAQDPDGRLYRYHEIYRTQRLVEDHARDILALTAGEPRPQAIICDHNAEDRATLERHLGMFTQPAHKSISDGIQAVASRLKVAADGKPRLYLLRDSLIFRDEELAQSGKPTCTEEEIDGYVWNTHNGRHKGEEPLKENDHGMDAMRYLVANRDLQGRVCYLPSIY